MAALWGQLKESLKKSSQRWRGWRTLLTGEALSVEQRALFEDILLAADIGVATTEKILRGLRKAEDLPAFLVASLKPYEGLFQPKGRPSIVLTVGINGSGKTTTLGKWAFQWIQKGHRVRLVAADTFRAGAVEQLAIWAQRVGATFTSGEKGADPSSVVFRGLRSGQEEKEDIILIDTAGRLPHKTGLMDELQKINRTIEGVVTNQLPEASYEKVFIADATTGQAGVAQALEFHRAVSLTGCVMTKLDGTASGGLLFALTEALKLPIYGIGIGETAASFVPFEAEAFVNGLLQEIQESVELE
jgi:fused signal recognition particle receptor